MQTTIRDIIRTNIDYLTEDLLLTDAVKKIIQADLPGLPVVNDNKELIGFVSEHDCILPMISGTYHCDDRTLVKDLIQREPLSLTPDASLINVAEMMANKKPKIYPILDEGKLVGIIYRQDVLKALSDEMKHCKPIV
ncbi:CBS domain-containing protein [Sansalvadorimonas sp. 2012CJ34-2]|uniref:CBS domain-containing protein n=1 Tax=Parendozoicomonas callyspongiae TaxID=2942213 RepID=A0ABT0PHY6_9GAMM|nr:CBS domain-containing protein [Sansalvadorimonas sp. 2012CJ34-2]MCL6270955.1 CBS domain-containing protein [Sansalvadorimonas sp. 2012CJ34-2]